ncbi:hypothetical protein [Nocardiopsis suaedae]|uniref:Glycosyltransferase RgtA/B/C/D-like domain-containing protein n=1 Tax=Nocardiopsis suaedae TaxID=3018444 RepID=A0ABT4TLD2_9ACTN|nr:hypothetical protein [Nocardiopsis suaedae]MDA2805485.1 hypothetical protein [Nocardiopsis suaedae]
MSRTPGRLLARATVLPAFALAGWLLVAFPLLLIGWFTPLAGLAAGVPAVAFAAYAAVRWTPEPRGDPPPWWPVAATLLVAAAFTAVQLAYHAEALVIRRDPASYAQYTIWIAQHGSLPIPQGRALIAGDAPGLTYGSLAYYQVGDEIWPQFLAGAPLLYAVGHWIAGPAGMVLVPPVVGGLAVLAFGGLAARLVGARWAPLAALLLAASLPVQWASRSTYSEPVAQLLMLGGLAVAVDALSERVPLRGRWGRPHLLAGAAGLMFGLGLVVRIDMLRDALPVVAVAGLLVLARRGQGVPLALGLAAGAGYGLVAGFGLSRPYLEHLSASLDPLLVICGAVVAATAVGTAALWRHGVPRTDRPPWLPTAAAAVVALAAVGLALRPLLWPEYGHGDEATANFVGQVQDIEGLPHDPDRNYEDMSLYWVGWYLGLGGVLFGTLGACLLTRRVLLRRAPEWVLPLAVMAWSVAATLARPAITPDHPWASRRLVVLVLPAFVLLAVWFLAWAARRLEALAPPDGSPGGRVLAPAAVAVGALAVLVPAAATSVRGLDYRSDVGTIRAAESLCAAIPGDASVVLVDGVGHYYGQLIRGMCGVPVATAADGGAVLRAVEGIAERGRTPVLAAEKEERLRMHAPPGALVEHPFHVRSDQDPSTLMEPPSSPWAFHGDIWVAVLPDGVPPAREGAQ